ncbi:unnamed protein product [Rangifer tarandus platyrhynchus]|uniref:B box-type domain-containing protein n=2 Tax=Rangifer tarandus platyrhynchus TaxID=3082113 RepID=A0ABN9A0N9_RANTA|nr:unnamed protein product [Rangifer tarandus platyrhynchus]CAI9711537.1 unnamed protein product [Rangifer tarandus platyrhynchus]
MRLLVTCGECLCEACAATRPIVSVPRRVNGEASARRAIVGPGLAERRLRAGKSGGFVQRSAQQRDGEMRGGFVPHFLCAGGGGGQEERGLGGQQGGAR